MYQCAKIRFSSYGITPEIIIPCFSQKIKHSPIFGGILINTPNIYNDKYTSAPLPKFCAPRNELLAKLNLAVERRFVFISAPAGSGKTVSALLWLKSSERKPVWIGLDAYDNSVSIFYRLLCAGLLSVQPDNKRMGDILSDPKFNASPIEHTINFLSEFQADENEYALVLDDFHTITNKEILKSLPYIFRRMPHSFVTLILSRGEPNTHFADIIEQGQAEVISGDTLKFARSEIGEYFSMLGREISSDDAQIISNYSGGWAIGVNALAHSSASVAELRESGEQVLGNYIERHLWREWDEGLRNFMLDSAVLDEMPVALCAKITKRDDAHEILKQLQMRNAFVSRVEDGVYRYHHLFLDFLREQPEFQAKNKAQALNTATEYYNLNGDDISSQRYAYESGNIKAILKLFDTALYNENYHLEEFLDVGRDFYTAPSMETLCEKCPVLYTLRAYVAFLIGDAEMCIATLEKLKRNMLTIIIKYPQYAELAFACGALDFRASFLDLAKTADRLPPFSFHKKKLKIGFLTVQMPFLQRINRDYRELSDPASWPKVKNNYGRLYKDHYDAMRLCKSSGFSLEKNHLQAALAEALEARDLIFPQMAKEMRFSVHMHLAAVYFAAAKQNELAEVLGETEEFISNEAHYLRPNFLAFAARIKLWDGDLAAAKEWLAHYFVNEEQTLEIYRIYRHFTTVRAYAVLNKLEKAEDLATRLRKLGKDFLRIQDAAEAGAILAAVLRAQGKKDKAQEMLEDVLLELQPYEFVRLAADEGAAILPILKKISAKCERADYSGELSPLYVKSVYLAAHAVSKQRRGILSNIEINSPKLSKKQKLVIELLAKGHSREGVANAAGLSLNTVKTHMRIAYDKLEVDNAVDAVAKARKLEFVE